MISRASHSSKTKRETHKAASGSGRATTIPFPAKNAAFPAEPTPAFSNPSNKPSRASELLPAAADELAADAVSRIASRFPHRDGHTALAQTDAQRQAGQSSAHNGDTLTHFFSR
jgi:hypothetical protein